MRLTLRPSDLCFEWQFLAYELWGCGVKDTGTSGLRPQHSVEEGLGFGVDCNIKSLRVGVMTLGSEALYDD